ncbi:MAG: helix-turn-helix domain-containing protein [Lachnospiraceae bacterium]|nr:helix-turn-helix domain-containing protein [Lachnospiraceae bacterium]
MDYPVLDVRAIGARIKTLRKEHHLTVGDIAEFMGFESEQAVYKWQRGDSLPTVDNLYALSVLFETSVDTILIGDREEDAGPSLSVYSLGEMYGILYIPPFIFMA